MRIGLRGSVSTGRLSNLSQQSGTRSRSGTGTWSGVGGRGPSAWPRAFVRGGVGSGGGAVVSTSWTKLSVVTRTPRYPFGHEQSPGQLSTAEIFSGADTTMTPDHERMRSPSPGSRTDARGDVGNGYATHGRRWTGDIPFRDASHSGVNIARKTKDAGEMKMPESSGLMPLRSSTVANTEGARGSSRAEAVDTLVDESTTRAAEDSIGSSMSDAEYDHMCQSEDRHCIFAPKTICVISRFPIYGVLRRFLRHLYAISLSRSGVPLERYISMFVSCIPMPPPGGCCDALRLFQDAAVV